MTGNGKAHKRFNHTITALVTSLALLTSPIADADNLATGAVYGGPATHTESCYIFNAGSSSVKIISGHIFPDGSTVLP